MRTLRSWFVATFAVAALTLAASAFAQSPAPHHAALTTNDLLGKETPQPEDRGSSAPVVLLDSVVFVVGAGALIGVLIWFTKRAIIDERF